MLSPPAIYGGKRKKRVPMLIVIALSLLLVPATPGNIEATSSAAGLPDVTQQLQETTDYLDVRTGVRNPLIYAKSVILLNAENGDELWSDSADDSLAVASTTKMTTALTAMKLFKPDEVVTIQKSSTLVAGSKILLKAGEEITVEDLLKGLLIQSGNDAAFALADHYGRKFGGDYQLFVVEMNKFSKEHGLLASTYSDPAGLDDDIGRSTARTLAHTARLLLRDPLLAKIVRIPTEIISSVDGTVTHELKNSNRLVLGDSPYYMPNAAGVKTGFTPIAGHCLVAAYDTPAGKVIGVILNTNEYTITASAAEMNKLFTWAHANVIKQLY